MVLSQVRVYHISYLAAQTGAEWAGAAVALD